MDFEAYNSLHINISLSNIIFNQSVLLGQLNCDHFNRLFTNFNKNEIINKNSMGPQNSSAALATITQSTLDTWKLRPNDIYFHGNRLMSDVSKII